MKRLGLGVFAFLLMTVSAWAKPMVAVSIPPEKFLIDEIGGGTWQCLVVVDKAQDPHVFEPTPRQLVELRKCEMYFRIGLPFETVLVDKLLKTNPTLHVVRLSESEEHVHEAVGAGETHHDDPHSWMSPDELVEQSKVVATELAKLDPENAKAYSQRQEAFGKRVSGLKKDLKTKLEKASVKIVAVYHPAWGHFAEAFGLEQVAIEAHGQTPGARHLSEVADKLKAGGVKVMLVQNETERRRIGAFAENQGLRLDLVCPLAENVLDTIGKTVDALCADSIATPKP